MLGLLRPTRILHGGRDPPTRDHLIHLRDHLIFVRDHLIHGRDHLTVASTARCDMTQFRGRWRTEAEDRSFQCQPSSPPPSPPSLSPAWSMALGCAYMVQWGWTFGANNQTVATGPSPWLEDLEQVAASMLDGFNASDPSRCYSLFQ